MKGYLKIAIIAVIVSAISYLIYSYFFIKQEEISPVPQEGIKIENKR